MLNILVMSMMAPLWRQSSVATITSMEITSNCLLFVRYFFLGLVVGASLLEPSPNSIICSNWHAKLLPCFPTSSFDHNFGTNDTQHSMYMQKVPLYYTERTCVILFWREVSQVLRTRGSTEYTESYGVSVTIAVHILS